MSLSIDANTVPLMERRGYDCEVGFLVSVGFGEELDQLFGLLTRKNFSVKKKEIGGVTI